MKQKLILLLFALFMTMGSVWAQETTVVTYGKGNGTFYDANNNVITSGFDARKFVSNTTPAVTVIASGVGQLNASDDANGSRLGLNNGENIFTISVPKNYVIVSYGFECKAVQTGHVARTLTTESEQSLDIPTGNNTTWYSVSETDINKQSTYFTVTTTGWSPINTRNFKITVKEQLIKITFKLYDENSKLIDTQEGYYHPDDVVATPTIAGYSLGEGEPTSITVAQEDAVYELHYVSSSFDYTLIVNGAVEGMTMTIKGDEITFGQAEYSSASAVEVEDVIVTFPSEYSYMTAKVSISGATITVDCEDTRWPVNFDKNTLRSTHASRYTDKVGLNNQSITFASAVGDLIYHDLTNQNIFVLPVGATVTPVIGYRGWAMYGYLYIDYNNDGDFTDDGELVSQLSGNIWTGGDTSDKTIPDFTLTSTPGDYRVRFKIEWNNTNPGGGPQIAEHGGCIIDATLKVINNPFFRLYAEEESAYLQGNGSLTYSEATGNASIWYYDGTKLCNFSGNFNSAAQFSNAATAGSYSITAGEALDKSFSIVEDVDALPVSISAAGYATLYSPVALTIPSGVNVYTASDEGEYLSLKEIEGQTIPANTGVILEGTGSYNFYLTDDVEPISSALTGSVASVARPEDSYILATGSAGVGFYKDGASTIPGFKAYLPASAGGDVKTFRFDDDATSIENVQCPMFNVQSSIYNLAGQRMNKMQKGINIVNGKKVLY